MTDNPPGTTTTERLAKRLARQLPCSRADAERYIEGGWVSVDGQVQELPGARVAAQQQVQLAAHASLLEQPPVTLLLHKPPDYEAGLGLSTGAGAAHASRSRGAADAQTLLHAGSHCADDPSRQRPLLRHFKQLECFTPLPTEASGLVVFTQDRRIARKLWEDTETLEQECIVQVSGQIADGGLQQLCHGLSFNGQPLPPIKVSWQNEQHLRFALKGVRPGQIPSMCEAVGLQVQALRRIRIGRVPLAKLAVGQWRYLQGWERF